MTVSTYHAHSSYSDGENTLEEMVQSAIKCGMKEIGFTEHAPMMFDCSWSMPNSRVADYKKEVLYLKEKYKNEIKIYLGIEQDYFSTKADSDYEYVLGSVHFVYKNGEYLPVDISAEGVKAFIDKHYASDPYEYCEDYFKLVGDIYEKTKCHIIGHFDLVTKFNEKMPMIDINHPRYVKAYTEALDKLLKTPAIFEINTGAISRGYRTSPYPDRNMIDYIAKAGKPFAVCSDTHNVDSVDCHLEAEREELDKKGYRYIKSLKEIL